MTIFEIASFQSRFFSRWDEDYFAEMMRHFGLDPKRRIRQLSAGQRAQVSLALALANQPDLLIMDGEPWEPRSRVLLHLAGGRVVTDAAKDAVKKDAR